MAGHDDLDQRWRAANRVPSGITHTDASCELMDEIRARIVASGRPVEKRSRSRLRLPVARRGVVLGSAIGVLAVGGVAAAATTIFASGTIGAPGFCQAARNATASVQYPAGDQAWQNWVLLESTDPKLGTTLHEACDDATQQYVDKGPDGGTYNMPINVYQGEVAQSAFCAWASDWLGAESSGDTGAASTAAGEIAGALQWPVSRTADPHPEFGPSEGDDSDQSTLGWFIPAQRAVLAGDVQQVASMFSIHGTGDIGFRCWFWQPAANSDDGTVLVLKPGQHEKP